MKTVLILGAGVSRAAGGSKPVAKRPPLDTDFFDIARAAKHKGYREVDACLSKLVGEYSSTLKGSLETAATYLYLKALDTPSGSRYHLGFLNLLKLLAAVLARSTNELRLGRRSLIYRFLLSELKKAEDPENLSIITFNYDLVIENTLQQIALNGRADVFGYPSCYRIEDYVGSPGTTGQPKFEASMAKVSGVCLLKLHGSMNWQSVHTSDTPRPSALFHPNRELHIINSKRISTALSWRRKQRRMYLKPIIIPPTTGKRGIMHRCIVPLWAKAGELLEEADRVVVAGYSCPPLDLEARILLSENLRHNDKKKLYVIDPNTESAAKFVDICGVSHTTIYSSIKDWVDDAVV